jgi:hypothetical protein
VLLRHLGNGTEAAGRSDRPSTLLGPEETGAVPQGTYRNLELGQHDGGTDVPPEGWHRPYLENCTVDASIFNKISVVFAKFLRAHGGCLGTRSR